MYLDYSQRIRDVDRQQGTTYYQRGPASGSYYTPCPRRRDKRVQRYINRKNGNVTSYREPGPNAPRFVP